jgi:hypothetical protein
MIVKAKKTLSFTIQEELTNKNLRVSEDLANSWQFEPIETLDGPGIRAFTNDIAANALEYGTVPAVGEIVNIGEILDWMQKKGVVPSYGTEKQMAFAIAKAIGKQGLPLHGKGLRRPFANARKRAERRLRADWERGMAELVRSLNG